MTMGKDLESYYKDHKEREREEARKYRMENFRVEVEQTKYGTPDQLTIKWTYNGTQWMSADFTAHERLIMIRALMEGLR
jgi:hypothetical protein